MEETVGFDAVPFQLLCTSPGADEGGPGGNGGADGGGPGGKGGRSLEEVLGTLVSHAGLLSTPRFP